MGGRVARRVAAEFVGTLVLVYFAVGVATQSFGFGVAVDNLSAGVVATALAFGLVLLVLVYAIGPVSGCHINPAVTLGVLLVRRISPRDAGYYWIAQFIGGILGALLLWLTFSGSALYDRSKTGLGANGWGADSIIQINAGGAFLSEAILTALFVFIVLSMTSPTAMSSVSGVAIGMGLALVHLIGIPITGTSVNPARSLGPAIVTGGSALTGVWLFIVAPLTGAVLAAAAHNYLQPTKPDPLPPTGAGEP